MEIKQQNTDTEQQLNKTKRQISIYTSWASYVANFHTNHLHNMWSKPATMVKCTKKKKKVNEKKKRKKKIKTKAMLFMKVKGFENINLSNCL